MPLDRSCPRSTDIAGRLLVVVAAVVLAVSTLGCTAGASPSPVSGSPIPAGSTSPDDADRDDRDEGRRGGVVGPITITRIAGSSVSLSTADGWARTITLTAETEIQRGGQPIEAADLRVGDEVRLRQHKLDDGSYQVTLIAVIVPVIHGTVTAIGSTTMTIDRRGGTSETVTLTSSTAYRAGDEAATRADVRVGGVVTVAGTRAADGALTAITVRIRLDKVSGTVASKTATTIVLTRRDGSSTTVRVDAATDYHVRGVENPTLADVDVGMRAAAVGIRRADGSMDAADVVARPPKQRPDAAPGASPAASPAASASG